MKFSTHTEKRLFFRRKWRSKIVFEDEFGSALLYLYSKDISLGGIFLKDSPPLKLGTYVFLSFVLPGHKRSLKATGQVVRFVEHKTNPLSEVRQDVGLRFIDLEPKTLKDLAGFLEN